MAFTVQESSLKRLANKTAIITGGSSGIGLATAKLFVSLGSNVVIADRQPPTESINAFYVKCDILSFPSQRNVFNEALRKYGSIDVVFANAGIAEINSTFYSMEEDENGELKDMDHNVLDIDIRATADTIRLAIYHMRKSGKGGSIVTTASLAGYLGTRGIPLYIAAKHGVVGMMRALKNDVKSWNIAISVLAPATVVTPILAAHQQSNLDEYVAGMRKAGVSLSAPKSAALAVGYLANKGMEANGMGVLVQSDKLWELESGLAKTRKIWFGEEMLGYFKTGSNAKSWSKI